MASNDSSKQQEEVPPPKQQAEAGLKPPKPKDDPTPVIKGALEIVEILHTKVVRTSQHEEVITRGRSEVVNPSSSDVVPENGGLRRSITLPPPKTPTDQDESERYIPKLIRNLHLLREDVVKLQDLRLEVADEVAKHITPLEKLLRKVEKGSSTALTKGMKKDLEDINKKIFNLMCQVPLLPKKFNKRGELDAEGGDLENDGKGIECLQGIHANEEDLKRLAVFRQVREKFQKLSIDRKICLLSFSVFPENQEVNRTMLMYWWIGEGFLSTVPDSSVKPKKVFRLAKEKPSEKDRPEDVVKAILEEFVEQKLIEPVDESKRKVEPNSYKMTPFVHSSVVLISDEIGLFRMYQKGEKPKMHKSELNKVCLVEGSSSQTEAKAKKMPDVKLIETVFNVSERFPDFAFKWFSDDQASSGNKSLVRLSTTVYKNLMVFYLGRWERTAKRHIEVENPELMKHLKHMTKLRLLSFQGISRIEILDDAVCKLHDLIILDLRACYNLEKLPEKIDALKKLIYLDITDCYMIDRMPKRMSWLENLEVLKGFVVSDATDDEKVCLLDELKNLKKLRKLSITINKGGDFNVTKLFADIEDFDNLEKLKVAWGGINDHKKEETFGGGANKLFRVMTFRSPVDVPVETKKQKPPKELQLPKKLKKLDLQCYPDEVLPPWLQPSKLLTLEKLYIKGGSKLTGFEKLDPETPTNCNVKVLRLKFLPRLKVEWRELRELYFPKLEFLDKYQCPQVSFCPCDGIGIWRKNRQV